MTLPYFEQDGPPRPIVRAPIPIIFAPCTWLLVLRVGRAYAYMAVHVPHEIAYPNGDVPWEEGEGSV